MKLEAAKNSEMGVIHILATADHMVVEQIMSRFEFSVTTMDLAHLRLCSDE